MARSSVQRDLALMVFRTGGTEVLRKRLSQITSKYQAKDDESFQEIMERKQKEFTDSSNALKSAYSQLQTEIEKLGFFDDEANTIINQLASVYDRTTTGQQKSTMLDEIFTFNNIQQSQLFMAARDNFYQQYNSFFNQMVDSYSFLSSVGSGIRNDKLLYAIGNNKDIAMLNEKGYAQLLKNEGSMFGLTFNSNGTIAGIEIRKAGIKAMQQAFQDKELSGDILTGIMEKQINPDSNLTYKDVWRQIKSANLMSASYNKDGKQLPLDTGRQFELLMSGKFANLTGDNIGDQIKDIIAAQNGQIKLSENKAGLAGGDTNLEISGLGRVTIQDKFSNKGNGWNGIGYQGIMNAFSFYTMGINSVMQKMSENSTDEEIAAFLDENYYKTENIDDMIYSAVEDLWVETMSADDSGQLEQLLNDY